MSPQRPRRPSPCRSPAARGCAGRSASPLAAGGSGSITLRAAVQTATGQPFTNKVTLNGNDAAGNVYSAIVVGDGERDSAGGQHRQDRIADGHGV